MNVLTVDASVRAGIGPSPVIGPGPGPVSQCTDNFGPSPGTDDLTKQSVPVQ
jgi:hypothetical protein